MVNIAFCWLVLSHAFGGFSASAVTVVSALSALMSRAMCLTQIYEKFMELSVVLTAVRTNPPEQCSPSPSRPHLTSHWKHLK